MGIVYTPLLNGFDKYTKDLPYACTLCGACAETCPVKIPLHELILAERQDIVEEMNLVSREEREVFTAAGQALGYSPIYRLGTRFGNPAMKAFAKITGEGDQLTGKVKLPVLKNWTQSRDLPLLRAGEFRDWFKKHEKEGR